MVFGNEDSCRLHLENEITNLKRPTKAGIQRLPSEAADGMRALRRRDSQKAETLISFWIFSDLRIRHFVGPFQILLGIKHLPRLWHFKPARHLQLGQAFAKLIHLQAGMLFEPFFSDPA